MPLHEVRMHPSSLQRSEVTRPKARRRSSGVRRQGAVAFGSGSGAARRAAGGGGGGRRGDGTTVSELPPKLRYGGGLEGAVAARVLATHQAVPDGGRASSKAVASLLETLRSLSSKLAAGAAPDGRVRKPERVTTSELAAIGGRGASALRPFISCRAAAALRSNAVPGSRGHAADGAPPSLWIITQTMTTVLESPERGDWRRWWAGRRSRLVKLAALAGGFRSGANGRVAGGRIANDNASAPNPLRNSYNVGDITLIPLLCSKSSSVASRDRFRVLVDHVVAVLVELRDEPVSNVLARRVRRDP